MSDSESDEDVKRKVVSKKDKYTEDLKESVRKLNNDIKINDWKSVVECEWPSLCLIINWGPSSLAHAASVRRRTESD